MRKASGLILPRFWLFAAAVLPLCLSCVTPDDNRLQMAVDMAAGTPSPALTHREFMDKAKAMARDGKFEAAMAIIDILRAESPIPAELAELAREIELMQFQLGVEQSQRLSERKAITEVDERLVLPENYGRVVVISGLPADHSVPMVGAMEELLNRPVSMDIRDAGIGDIVLALSEVDGMNIVADNALESEETLTVVVSEVKLKELLNYIARNMGVAFHLGDNVVWVTNSDDEEASRAPKMETAIFRLKTGSVPTIDDDIIVVGGEGGEGGESNESELDDALKNLLERSPAGASYRIYKNRNLLMVKNTIENIRLVDFLLKELDQEIRQVIIEARFITISQTDIMELGFNLEQISPVSPEPRDKIKTVTNQLLRSFPATGNLTLAGVIQDWNYQAVIHAIDEKKSTRSLSMPRIAVLNNQTARIHEGRTIRYFEEFDVATVRAGVIGNDEAIPVPTGMPQELQVGLKLAVKPTIGHDGRKAMLDIMVENSDFTGWEYFGITIGGEERSTAKLPNTVEMTLETKVVVGSGQTLVLGGTMRDTKESNKEGIPFISRLPLVGTLFADTSEQRKPLHLLVFITTRILDSSGNYVSFED